MNKIFLLVVLMSFASVSKADSENKQKRFKLSLDNEYFSSILISKKKDRVNINLMHSSSGKYSSLKRNYLFLTEVLLRDSEGNYIYKIEDRSFLKWGHPVVKIEKIKNKGKIINSIDLEKTLIKQKGKKGESQKKRGVSPFQEKKGAFWYKKTVSPDPLSGKDYLIVKRCEDVTRT